MGMHAVLSLILDIILAVAKLFRPGGRSLLLAEYFLIRQQLIAVNRKRKRAPKLTTFDRIIFGFSALFINAKRLPKLSSVVAHSTLLGFHRALVNRKYSKLFSNKRPGPKGPSADLINLIVEIKTKNPGYGCPKIALLVSELLGQSIDEQMVRRILRKHFSSQPRGSGPSWLNAIGSAKDVLWSVDLFCCESISLQTHWVMVVMDHYTREIIGFAVVRGAPCGADVCRMIAAIRCTSGRSPRHLSSDNDPLFKFHRWIANLSILYIDEIKTVPETPWSRPFIERVIGTIRREYLDGTLFWGEMDLQVKLNQFKCYYNEARVHSSIDGKTPLGLSGCSAIGRIEIKNYDWKSYCNGRFSVPVAA